MAPKAWRCGCNAVSVLISLVVAVTRATLLHVLERPTALGPAEVRELEQLAQAFPYCQTAHLLLAKAAHDQGTMLAGQRLRRAATYAADRTLLRRLIEQKEAAATPEPVVPLAAPHPLDLVDWPDEYVSPVVAPPLPGAIEVSITAKALSTVAPLPVTALQVAGSVVTAAESIGAAEVIASVVTTTPSELFVLSEPAPALTAVPPLTAAAPPASTVLVEAPTPVAVARAIERTELPTATPVAEAPAVATPVAGVSLAPAAPEIIIPVPAAEETLAVVVEPAPVAIPEAVALVAAEVPVFVEPAIRPTEPLPTAPTASETAAAAPAAEAARAPATEEPEAELPAQAPAIRPPVEVGEARFEFGLADPTPAVAVPTYELPGLVDEWAASAVTRGLGSPEMLVLATPAPDVPVFTPAAFTGDIVVGYAFGESSRLGLSMQLLDLLTARAEVAESVTAVVAAAQPPATPLPPTGTFFEPDLLLLHHWATHRPAAPEQPSTVDLINNFLKRQPRLTRPAMLPPAATHQADLSVRSTRAEPNLVSENLARIFVRQGKTARAIEIYEKLMVKQPEKMAYFTAQIQSLQPSA